MPWFHHRPPNVFILWNDDKRFIKQQLVIFKEAEFLGLSCEYHISISGNDIQIRLQLYNLVDVDIC